MTSKILHRMALTLAILASSMFVFLSTGCRNTAHGVGEDVENIGEGIQRRTQ